MSSTTLPMTEPLNAYLHGVSLRESPEQKALREATQSVPRAAMQISPEQGQLMALLVELIDARRAIEIGTFTGYSALCVAQALPPDGRLVCCEVDGAIVEVGRPFWHEAGVADRIELRIGPALATLDEMLAQGRGSDFDFAFIDADKPSHDAYYERCLALVRPGGLIAIDNVLWSGRVIDESDASANTSAIRALNRKVHQDPRVTIAMLPIGDGLTLARRRA